MGDKLKLEARVYISQCKREQPHLTTITIADNNIQDIVCAPQDKIKLIYLQLSNLETNVY